MLPDTRTTSSNYPPRIVSGIQPSRQLHLGHYFGAIKQHLELQHEYPGEAFFLIADYHTLTGNSDAKSIRHATTELATAYLALGLDPNKAVLYRQSDVPQALELFWILSRYTTTEELARVPTYKAATTEIPKSAALLTYPVLMAADVLGMRATAVPVGKDQEISIERLRDIARRFNTEHKVPLFPVPKAKFSETPLVLGLDGRKMHNRYQNTVRVFDSFANLNRAVRNIKTDSRGKGEAKDPSTCTVFHLYSLVADPDDIDLMRSLYRTGGISYEDAKRRLVTCLQEYFAEASEKYEELRTRPNHVEDILRAGYEAAAEQIDITVDIARQIVGLTY